ncbi:hypothetical protein HDU96_010645 [Phlyctochytrium bullatum]|nr:hypothetical protein HDU96_010645 [Phlyctochytrium bullatum]
MSDILRLVQQGPIVELGYIRVRGCEDVARKKGSHDPDVGFEYGNVDVQVEVDGFQEPDSVNEVGFVAEHLVRQDCTSRTRTIKVSRASTKVKEKLKRLDGLQRDRTFPKYQSQTR